MAGGTDAPGDGQSTYTDSDGNPYWPGVSSVPADHRVFVRDWGHEGSPAASTLWIYVDSGGHPSDPPPDYGLGDPVDPADPEGSWDDGPLGPDHPNSTSFGSPTRG
jgi:hypothetical protein